ncbi:MAG: prepilin peptidase [Vulcanimicrobiaceae bacterium]
MAPLWVVAISAVVYACAAFLAAQWSEAICRNVTPFEDGPRSGTPPTLLLIAAAGILGGVVASRGLGLEMTLFFGMLAAALVGAWCSDVRCGLVPDVFTLVPLAIIVVASAIGHQFAPAIAAAVIFVPFGAAAFLSKGRGMGWGDVKLCALGASLLSLETAIIAYAGACLAAVMIAAARNRRSDPIAFAPYLASAVAIAVVLVVRPGL